MNPKKHLIIANKSNHRIIFIFYLADVSFLMLFKETLVYSGYSVFGLKGIPAEAHPEQKKFWHLECKKTQG